MLSPDAASVFAKEFTQQFQWSAIPPLECLSTDVFAGEPDISGTWDQYGLRLPSGAVALFLYCRETEHLEVEEDPAAWDGYNPPRLPHKYREQAISLAEDIVWLARNCGIKPGKQDGQLCIPFDFPTSSDSHPRLGASIAGYAPER